MNIKTHTTILSLCILLLYGCFEDRLNEEINKGNGTIIKFEELTDFTWDHVYIYGPYYPIEEINKKHGTKLKAEHDYPSYKSVSEGDFLYLFMFEGKAVKSVFTRRNCKDILDPGVYTPDNAIFEVQNNKCLKWVKSDVRKRS